MAVPINIRLVWPLSSIIFGRRARARACAFIYWWALTAKKCQRRPTKIVKVAAVKSFVLNTALILKGAESVK